MSEMTTRQSTITSYGPLVSVWRNKHMLEEFWRLTNAPELDSMSRYTCVTFYDVVALLCAPLSISRSLLWYLQCVVITGHSHQHSQFNKSLSPKYNVVTHCANFRDTLLFLQSPPPLLSSYPSCHSNTNFYKMYQNALSRAKCTTWISSPPNWSQNLFFQHINLVFASNRDPDVFSMHVELCKVYWKELMYYHLSMWRCEGVNNLSWSNNCESFRALGIFAESDEEYLETEDEERSMFSNEMDFMANSLRTAPNLMSRRSRPRSSLSLMHFTNFQFSIN